MKLIVRKDGKDGFVVLSKRTRLSDTPARSVHATDRTAAKLAVAELVKLVRAEKP